MFSAIGTSSMSFYSVKIPNKFDGVFELWLRVLMFFLSFKNPKEKNIKKYKGRRFCFYIL